MRTLVHLSDLHFGRIDHAIIDPLIELVQSLAPDLVVVSGDLTQRARIAEFKQARRFLDALPTPQIVVPGNHDIPLFNLFRRFAQPLANYRRYITDELAPVYVDDEIAVVGINTARSLTVKDGRISAAQIAGIRSQLYGLGEQVTKVVVTHHPFDLPESYRDQALVGRARFAMMTFADCGADLLLAGHLHVSHADSSAARHPIDAYAALMVQAGTATSTRMRGESNSFNVIRIGTATVAVERFTWEPERRCFTRGEAAMFARIANSWAAMADV